MNPMPPRPAATRITAPVTVAAIAAREGLSAASFTDHECSPRRVVPHRVADGDGPSIE
jgi:hypothetical protein